ncbi:hypothetical protein AQ490_07775 [Wenjunlia vitaminophila]|uniref:Uncharacterized protein n=1 Tax=Wenjunlia vitaminophila TaxID=76728 RepID=A0A0T6LN08_WENVI|nr:hypothetical protein [Wenjunlia vitaminophila]KRV47352.1 hypothetical protein AQ490_07775 [Wenjunlia vitaminophila]
MEAELAALAVSGATTLVGSMVTDSWAHVRDRVAAFLGRDRDGQTEQLAAELEAARGEVTAAQESESASVTEEIQAEWRSRLRRVLRQDPALAQELRALLEEFEPPAEGARCAGSISNSVSGGVQNAPVVQGQDFYGLSINFGGAIPPGSAQG